MGDDIVITGAGKSGTSLVTTIAAVLNSSTSVTLGTAAITSVSGSALYAYGTPTQGTISGSFTVPSGLTCGSSCNVYVDEPNISLTQSTYGADGGTGTYNSGLTYQLVNSVEVEDRSRARRVLAARRRRPSPGSAPRTGQQRGELRSQSPVPT